MPTATRTLAKGIPPRVHTPKTKRKSALKHSSTKPVPLKSKRKASKIDNDSGDETSSKSGDSDPKPKQKRKAAKRRRTEEPESDMEIVDGAEPEPMVEEVERDPDSDDEVGTKHHIEMSGSHSNRATGLITINEVKTFTKNQ